MERVENPLELRLSEFGAGRGLRKERFRRQTTDECRELGPQSTDGKKVTRLLFFCTDIKGSSLCH